MHTDVSLINLVSVNVKGDSHHRQPRQSSMYSLKNAHKFILILKIEIKYFAILGEDESNNRCFIISNKTILQQKMSIVCILFITLN